MKLVQLPPKGAPFVLSHCLMSGCRACVFAVVDGSCAWIQDGWILVFVRIPSQFPGIVCPACVPKLKAFEDRVLDTLDEVP